MTIRLVEQNTAVALSVASRAYVLERGMMDAGRSSRRADASFQGQGCLSWCLSSRWTRAGRLVHFRRAARPLMTTLPRITLR